MSPCDEEPIEERGLEGGASGEGPLDDDLVTLPALDGEPDAGAPEDAGLVPSDEEERVGLDDEDAAELAAEAGVEPIADVESESWETGEDDPLDPDASLDEGEGERWIEPSEPEGEGGDGSADDEGLDEPPGGGAADDDAEGIEEELGELDLPPRSGGLGDEQYPDELELG